MAENSKIEWTKHTCNLWWGCTKVHEGCDHCYAETLDNRYNHDNTHWGNDKPRKAVKSVWNDFIKYQKAAAEAGEVHRVFVGSMMDIFEKSMPLEKEFILPQSVAENSKVIDLVRSVTGGATLHPFKTTGELRDFFFRCIVPLCPNLQFLLLTKRPSNINAMIPEEWKTNPPANVIFGTSIVNQETADRLIPQLYQVQGKRFLSCEPLLGPIDLSKEYSVGKGSVPMGLLMDWVICGGESGHNARPMHPDWALALHKKCCIEGINIPFFFKQWGEWKPIAPVDFATTPMTSNERWMNINGGHGYHGDSVWLMKRVGKHEAGNLLDGKQHKNFPDAI